MKYDYYKFVKNDNGSSGRLSGNAFAVLMFLAIFSSLVASRFQYTWDDSAITLAFSKNFAATGEIKPSVHSDRVEGYSSFLWMVVNSALFRAGMNETAAMSAAKISALAFNVMTLALLVFMIRERCRGTLSLIVCFASVALSGASLFESINGMETPLLSFLLLLSFFLYERRGRGAAYEVALAVVSSAVILTRHEAAWYLVPILAADIIERRAPFKKALPWAWLAVFVSYNAWHYGYFGTILTNPMIAKAHPPYTPEFSGAADLLWRHLLPLVFLVIDQLPLFTVPLMPARINEGGYSVSFRPFYCQEALFVAAGAIFNLAIGMNWGPKGRMLYPVLPFLALWLARAADGRLERPHPLSVVLLAPAVAVFIYMNPVFFLNVAGSQMQVEGFAGVWRAAERIMTAADLEKMTYAGPDMGGFLLHSRGLRVVDTALLCSGPLARRGYSAFGEIVFEKERPHVIKTHAVWTKVSGIYRDERLFTEYRPVVSSGVVFFVRLDVFEKLAGGGLLVPAALPVMSDGDYNGASSDAIVYGRFKTAHELVDGRR